MDARAGGRSGGAGDERGADPDRLRTLLHGHPGAAAARGAAIRQQLLEMPAPVVADALSYNDKTTARLLREGGGGWNRYTAGEHGTSP